MCGICGVWGGASRESVEAMVSAMDHRGPDDRGMYFGPGVALGMTRLSIIDLTPAAHQPMSNPDGTVWIVYNGETYNFQSERKLLEAKGYKFSSSSDTEVVLRMYEHYGDDFLLRLRGMFALAIYDKRKGPGRERLLLARDHLGIEPLLFAHVGSRLVFASEIKALLASGLIEPEIDSVALRLLLTFGSVYQPRTILRGVSMLLPAHRMIIERGKERIERYWSLGVNRQPGLRKRPYEELVAEVAGVLEESVRLQMVSDVPLGAFLSGGVDSSLLVAMMAQAVGQRVKTFSVGFGAEGADIDESRDAERTARFLGTDHTHVLVRGSEVRDRIQHIAYSLDQPSVDGVNSYFVSLAARQAVTVAISGTGGDELFAGYPWFISMVLDQQRNQKQPWKAVARSLLATLARQPVFDPLLLTRGGGRLYRARNWAGFVAKYATLYHIFGAWGAARLLSPELRELAQAGRLLHHDLNAIDELSEGSTIERVTGLCLRGYTNNQLLRDIDAVSMAHSLEVRVPYLDPLVVDTALSLPDSAKIGDLTNLSAPTQSTYRETGAKRILVDIGRPLLPKDFDLQPKRGFGMPFDTWLRGPLREVLLDTLSEGQIRRRGLLDVQEASVVKDRFLEGSIGWAQPWLLMMLELWCRQVLDQPPSALAHPRWKPLERRRVSAG
ncbi:MAG: asparagine synthase (glutamine-hydrolyzing) [Chloroflexi bacterium]|nr:asparagine synthase (glutamine-hydrolyzing) [Chloroflexota bacterium]